MPLTRPEIQRLVELEAASQGVDPAMALAVAQQESGFDPMARSPKGAMGVMQLMPRTAKDLGVNPNDPADNIAGGVKYLAQLSQRYGGDRERTLAAYNAGPGAVDRYKGVPPFTETRSYVSKILGMLGPASAEAAPVEDDAARLEAIEAELARRAQSAAPQPPADLSGDSTNAAETIEAMRAPGELSGQGRLNSGQVISEAGLQALATKRGMSLDQARAQARKAGVTVGR